VRLLSVDARRFGRDHAALARLIGGVQADVACVHGGPHLLRWRSKSAAIARRAGLVVVTGGRTAAANQVLSSLSVDVLALRDVRIGAGGAALAALRFRGAEFVVVAATLAGNAAQRTAQARELDGALRTFVPGDPPAIVSAEGADRPGTAAWQVLVEERVAVAARVFVDGRCTLGTATELAGDAGLLTELEL
jgi:hypothetical protein